MNKKYANESEMNQNIFIGIELSSYNENDAVIRRIFLGGLYPHRYKTD